MAIRSNQPAYRAGPVDHVAPAVPQDVAMDVHLRLLAEAASEALRMLDESSAANARGSLAAAWRSRLVRR